MRFLSFQFSDFSRALEHVWFQFSKRILAFSKVVMVQFDYYLDSTNHQPVEVVIQLHQLVLDTILYYATLYAFTRGMQYKYLKTFRPLDYFFVPRIFFHC